ncbi:MAG: hypothetical protein ABRQ39_30330 [Candidatus Eremiobacterota bacterium]
MDKCKIYDKDDVVHKYLIDYASYLAHNKPLYELDSPLIFVIDKLEEHFSNCEICMENVRKWLLIFERENKGELPSLESVEASLSDEKQIEEQEDPISAIPEETSFSPESIEIGLLDRLLQEKYIHGEAYQKPHDIKIEKFFLFLEQIDSNEVIVGIHIHFYQNKYDIGILIVNKENKTGISGISCVFDGNVTETDDNGFIFFRDKDVINRDVEVYTLEIENLVYKFSLQKTEILCEKREVTK